jgi:hypothetical protein
MGKHRSAGRALKTFKSYPADAVQAVTFTRIFLGPTGFLPVGPLCFWGSQDREADRPDDSAVRAVPGG